MSLPPRRAKRRDANQNEIVQALRKAGVAVWHQEKPADLLCGFRGRFSTIEVKDGKKPPSERKLTPDEQAYFWTCEARGLPHFVVKSVQEAFEALGMSAI